MLDLVAALPDHLLESFRSARALRFDGSGVNRVFLAGMGGSAIAGDVFASWAGPRSAKEMRVVRDYLLPPGAGTGDLLIAMSYSGNTEETLSVVADAHRLGVRVVAVTSGGRLEGVAADRGDAIVRIPSRLSPLGTFGPPRAAFGHLFGALPALCEAWIPGDLQEDVERACAHLRRLRRRYDPTTPRNKNRAKEVAERIGSRTPVVYATAPYGPVAKRWQTQFNENAKALAWASAFPEADHNEIVGWDRDAAVRRFVPIFLRDRDETPEMRRRLNATRDLLRRARVVEVRDRGGTLLSRILGTLLLGDFASVYLACLRKHDPAEVTIIDRLKARLSG